MEFGGFAGSVLYVDLTSGDIRKEPLDPELVRDFIGGWGISNKLAYDLIPPDVDPLSPENMIIFGTSPFVGTTIPGSPKLLVTTKFPLNGAFSTGVGGGAFSIMLKSSGYDYLVISGRAAKPVYLKILDDSVDICDATNLWGKDSIETTNEIRSRHEPCSIIPIGQAGENLVKFTVAYVDNASTVGAGGLPAIMGSKKLKAVVAVQGSKGVKVADQSKFRKLVDDVYGRMTGWRGRESLIEGGLGGSFLNARGDRPVSAKNMTELYFRSPDEEINYKNFARIYKESRKTLACPSCPMGDKEVVKIKQGKYKGAVFTGNSVAGILLEASFAQAVVQDMPESGTERAMGRLKREMEYADMLDRYGLDLVNFDRIMSFVVYLYQQGMITKEDTGGIELKEDWETAERLARMIAYREGFGNVLADGIMATVHKLGTGQKYAYQVKSGGLLIDPRSTGLGTVEFAALTSPRGSQYIPGILGAQSYNLGWRVEQWVKESRRRSFPEEALERIFTPTSFNVGRLMKWSEDWYSVLNLLSLCARFYVVTAYDAKTAAELYQAVTGIEMSDAALLKAGERAWNVYKLLNVRAGFGRDDDQPPEAWFHPVKGNGREYPLIDYYGNSLTREDMDRLLDDYYDERGWDKHSGTPTFEKLQELGLEAYSSA